MTQTFSRITFENKMNIKLFYKTFHIRKIGDCVLKAIRKTITVLNFVRRLEQSGLKFLYRLMVHDFTDVDDQINSLKS